MDHNYATFQEGQFDALDECYDNVVSDNLKYGDELLIDLVRSRPYLYDKTQREYKDMKMKENAWREMAAILNITVSDCQTRWTRLRQRYSKERMLREQETRSCAGKPIRPKWLLFESLNFLGKHMVHRKSITNMSFYQPLQTHQANKGINQDEDFEGINTSTVTAFDCFNTATNYFTIRAISCFITTVINCFTIRAISCFITTAINCFPFAPIDYFQFSAIDALRFRF